MIDCQMILSQLSLNMKNLYHSMEPTSLKMHRYSKQPFHCFNCEGCETGSSAYEFKFNERMAATSLDTYWNSFRASTDSL